MRSTDSSPRHGLRHYRSCQPLSPAARLGLDATDSFPGAWQCYWVLLPSMASQTVAGESTYRTVYTQRAQCQAFPLLGIFSMIAKANPWNKTVLDPFV